MMHFWGAVGATVFSASAPNKACLAAIVPYCSLFLALLYVGIRDS